MISSASIEHLLNINGPTSSSKIKDKLLAEGLTDEAARQRISRSRGNVKRLTTILVPGYQMKQWKLLKSF